MPDEPEPPPMRVVHKGWNTREEAVKPADVARAFNAWAPDRKDLMIAALRARVAELERACVQARGAMLLDAMVDEAGEPYGTTVVALEAINDALTAASAPDPRDARIAELEATLRKCRGLFIRVRDDWHEAEVVASEGFTAIDRALGEGHG